ncbi:hypothetical protein N781_09370 [Pontibacillus halophilus JSM 076056 = DSM 19796]|uniref:Uncharacterized protein n=1 Tax=Pontibacillus halophilus JSM 076056 = DSM 19796 TaxID=1385510 RepID=A0A0A5G850_9BACI|nr:hypothetical protein [Pontibacillus halophilus]KGX89316.1 hypothetical protein N781_09370 [Pontibacillus halophilus JSM 076056 = DSM 19796]
MSDKKFLSLIGIVGMLTWPIYFVMHVSSYTAEEIVKALSTIGVMTFIYFLVLFVYKR